MVELCHFDSAEYSGSSNGHDPMLVRTVFASGSDALLRRSSLVGDDNWLCPAGRATEAEALVLTHVLTRRLAASSGGGRQCIRLTTFGKVGPLGDELFRAAFPPGTVLSLSSDEDGCGDFFFTFSTEVCCGGADGSGVVAWEQPMTPEQLSSASQSLRDSVKAARKVQLLTSLAACLQTEWVGGILALAPSTRRLLEEDGRATCDNLVGLSPESVALRLDMQCLLDFQMISQLLRSPCEHSVFHASPPPA